MKLELIEMIRTIKKVTLSTLSVLIVSCILWAVALFNPQMMYAHVTEFGAVTVYHSEALEPETALIINQSIQIIQSSDLYFDKLKIDLCLNDGSVYPQLHPLKGGIAYSFLNKSVIYNSTPSFKENVATYQWSVNENEIRKVDLAWLLAHEFTHNLQSRKDPFFNFKHDFWKVEGYAEYISRKWKEDGLLREKIKFYIEEEQLEKIGLPVIYLDDGTVHIMSYYKYGLLVQYLTEVEGLNFNEICDDSRKMNEVFGLLLNWSKKL